MKVCRVGSRSSCRAKPRVRCRGAIGNRTAWVCVFLAARGLAPALVTNKSGSLPALKPPHAEIPPGFWESYGLLAASLAAIAVGLVALGIWYLLRPRPPVAVPAAVQARHDLEPLRSQPEDGLLLTRVSQVLRRYFSGGAPVQMTTAEVCGVIRQDPGLGPAVAPEACDFLRRCDELKFAPSPPAPRGSAVDAALDLVDKAESARRAHVAALAAAAGETPRKPA